MKRRVLLIAPFALLGCKQSAETDPPTTATETQAPRQALLPILRKDAGMTTKFKPFVFDLGGRQAIEAAGCALTVSFASVGTGIDSTTKRRIEQLLEDDSAVVEVQPFVIGREGETLLCVRLNPESEADRLFDELRSVAADAYLIWIQSKDGREFRSAGKRR